MVGTWRCRDNQSPHWYGRHGSISTPHMSDWLFIGKGSTKHITFSSTEANLTAMPTAREQQDVYGKFSCKGWAYTSDWGTISSSIVCFFFFSVSTNFFLCTSFFFYPVQFPHYKHHQTSGYSIFLPLSTGSSQVNIMTTYTIVYLVPTLFRERRVHYRSSAMVLPVTT